MKVVNWANTKITEFHTKFKDYLESTDKKTQYKLTSLVEVKAFIGLMYVRAALKLNGQNEKDDGYYESVNDIFPATMSRYRYSFLSKILQFDDPASRSERWKTDKFAAFRDFFESVNERFSKLRRPSAQLLSTRHSIPGVDELASNNTTRKSLLNTEYCFVVYVSLTRASHTPTSPFPTLVNQRCLGALTTSQGQTTIQSIL